MAHELPALPFEMDALKPHLTKETLEYHYGKHHQAYANKLNELIRGSQFETATLEDIIKKSEGGIFNNAAQLYNHTFYWNSLSPKGGGAPSGKIAEAINKKWGSFDKFKEEFTTKSTTLFGSGWCWLVKKGDSLEIVQKTNAGCPLTDGDTPILTCDVWEHAYYIDYRNARPKYVEAFWALVNWEHANKQLG